MRLLFVYKNNNQDPSEKALRRWLPRLVDNYKEYQFIKTERNRFDPDNLIFSESFKSSVEKFKPSHIFCWLLYLNPKEIAWCKSLGIKLVAGINGVASFSTGLYKSQLMYFDSLRQLDAFLIPHRPHIPILIRHGINAVEMPFFYDPDAYYPLPKIYKRIFKTRSDVFFVGNFGDYSKIDTQGAHRKKGIEILAEVFRVKVMSSDYVEFDYHLGKVRATGNDWIVNFHANHSKSAICFDYFPDLLAYNKINNRMVQYYSDNDKFTIRPRIFTMMGSGLPIFVERHPEIERLFLDGEDIIMWSNFEELRSKASYYLSKPKELSLIAQTGHLKAKLLHTVEKRLIDTILPTFLKL